ILEEGSSIEAREASIEANRLSPDLVPAAVLAARGYLEQGNKRNAGRVIRKAWGAQPHPDLAAVFAEIESEETPEARIKRFGKLLKQHPDNRETKLIEAELHLAAEDFPAARRALGDLAEVEPDSRSLTIMAAVERGEGAPDSVVKGWLARALTAPRGPQWVCDNCQHIHSEWVPACENCQSFDTLTWRSPPATTLTSSTGLEMLPLIVGAIEDKSQEPEEVAEAEVVEDEAAMDEPEIVEAEIVDEERKEPTST
ncbi:MAG: tetratricopeptide repeat protein, partial [Pseudomonadota bacterium]